jgi:EAL domain-containing protein (putative c-di-GMP-specific phosphodiesterase class I)
MTSRRTCSSPELESRVFRTDQPLATQLETVFQPVIELQSRRCVAYEALTRFPADSTRPIRDWFLEAHESGGGGALELRAIATALTHIGEIPPTTALAINVSPDVAVTDEFFELVAPYADRLIIELTEHDPVNDYESLTEALDALRALGARVAVDDVGAGYASLRHILRLAPDIVKLDLSLTRALADDPRARALAAALVEFATRTGSAIAAEGVETHHQLRLLRDLGIHQGQGYLLGRPNGLNAHLN